MLQGWQGPGLHVWVEGTAHTPAWQTAPTVHGAPLSHGAPSGLAGLLHSPVAGSQAPTSWQASTAAQATVAQRSAVPP